MNSVFYEFIKIKHSAFKIAFSAHDILKEEVANVQKDGLFNYLRMPFF